MNILKLINKLLMSDEEAWQQHKANVIVCLVKQGVDPRQFSDYSWAQLELMFKRNRQRE